MRNCAQKSRSATNRLLSFWSSATRRARTGSRTQCWAMKPTPGTSRRTRSSVCTNRPAVSTGGRAFRPGFTGCWLTCASTRNGGESGGASCCHWLVPATTRMSPGLTRPPATPDLTSRRSTGSRPAGLAMRSSIFLPISGPRCCFRSRKVYQAARLLKC